MTMTPLSNSSVLSNLHLKISSSEEPSPWLNNSTWPPIKPLGFGMTCFTLTFGAVSNLTALGILARVQRSRQSKTPFLLLTVALLLTDLGGHMIPGAFALYLHVGLQFQKQVWEPNKKFCQIFGASMVFFSLCPLLLGCAMAVERCVAITKPFFYNSKITLTYVRRVVFLLFSIALTLAVLPLCALGTYTTQYPGTWCFLPIYSPHSTTDSNLILVFSSLGFAALTLSLLCNILSGLALLQTRMRSHYVNRRSVCVCTRRPSSMSTSSMFYSLDVEMMVQLVAITVISCICWSPFFVSTAHSDYRFFFHFILQGFVRILILMLQNFLNFIVDPHILDAVPSEPNPLSSWERWFCSSECAYGLLEPDLGPVGLHPAKKSVFLQSVFLF